MLYNVYVLNAGNAVDLVATEDRSTADMIARDLRMNHGISPLRIRVLPKFGDAPKVGEMFGERALVDA